MVQGQQSNDHSCGTDSLAAGRGTTGKDLGKSNLTLIKSSAKGLAASSKNCRSWSLVELLEEVETSQPPPTPVPTSPSLSASDKRIGEVSAAMHSG